MIGFYVAMTAAVLLVMAALAAVGGWVPTQWLPLLAAGGAVALLCLVGLFAGPTKVIPMLFALGTLYLAVVRPSLLATS